MFDSLNGFVWDRVVWPAISGVFDIVPWYVWLVIAGLIVGWAWRTFGWQGLVGAGLALLTFFAYRQGWNDNQARLRGKDTVVPLEDEKGNFLDAIFKAPRPRAIPKKHRTWNDETKAFE